MKGVHLHLKRKKNEKLTVRGPCADTNKDFPRGLQGNLGIKPAIGPPTSLTYSKHRIQLLFFFSEQYNERTIASH